MAILETYDSNGNLLTIVDQRVLSDVMADMNNAINNQRDVIINNGMYYMGHWWATDATSRSNVTGAISTILVGVPLPSNFVWRDNVNVNVPMTSTQLITLGTYMAAWVQMVYTASWNFKATLNACTTLEEFDALPAVNDLPWPTGDMDGTMANAIIFDQMVLSNTAVSNASSNTITFVSNSTVDDSSNTNSNANTYTYYSPTDPSNPDFNYHGVT